MFIQNKNACSSKKNKIQINRVFPLELLNSKEIRDKLIRNSYFK